jgi:hypothetical protein
MQFGVNFFPCLSPAQKSAEQHFRAFPPHAFERFGVGRDASLFGRRHAARASSLTRRQNRRSRSGLQGDGD